MASFAGQSAYRNRNKSTFMLLEPGLMLLLMHAGKGWGKSQTPSPTPTATRAWSKSPSPTPTSGWSGSPGSGRRRGDDRHDRDGGFRGFGGFGRRLQERGAPASPADRPWRAAAFGAAGGQRRLATAGTLVSSNASRQPAADALLDAALEENLAAHRKDIGAARRR